MADCKLYRSIVLISLCLLSVLFCFRVTWAEEYILGVTYVEDPTSTFKAWQPLGNYLSKVLNGNVKVVPLDFNATVQWLENGKAQMVITNPLTYYVTKDKAHLTVLATTVYKIRGEAVDKYGSVIFVKSDSPLKAISEIRGKVVGIASKNSLGGGMGGLALLEQEGVSVDSITIKELKNQDNVAFAVLNGAVDVGIVRTGILEKLGESNKINLKGVKILHKIEDNFPFVHSTVLWPEWVLAVRSNMPQQLRDAMKKSLISINQNEEVLSAAGVSGFKDASEALTASAPFFDNILKIYNKFK